MLVVLDTNVLVSALLNPHGKPAAVLGLILEERLSVCYDSRVISEYSEVLRRPKFGFAPREVESVVDVIRLGGVSCVAHSEQVKGTDPGDRASAQVCIASKTEYLIRGNREHFPRRIAQAPVVSPTQSLDRYYADHG